MTFLQFDLILLKEKSELLEKMHNIGVEQPPSYYVEPYHNQLGFGSDKVVFREMLSSMYICLKAIIKKTRVQCSVLYSCTVFSLII